MSLSLLFSSIQLSLASIWPVTLNLLLTLLLLFLGLLIAKRLGQITAFVLNLVQLNKLAAWLNFSNTLERAGVKKTLAELLGDLVAWSLNLVVITAIMRFYGLDIEPALQRLFVHLGVVLVAALILGLGLFLAMVISVIVKVVIANLGLEGAQPVSKTIYYIIIVFAFLAALSELGFDLNNLAPHLGIIIGFPALAAAIAFGLGCKDMAADFFHNFFKGR
ncbi:hypothetical protein COT42_08485 [Candidatus Saganbacteria bacterium CG08_land_8_20_14_0_20_45_16]|uniref:Small-conductance mechanosensitive ion channel n=1 Tax=Candidatus Saganbacteria bacterium CG08_land_8_20_14_0_20_45_16 TaxID=2014293 RepID=A0A2H0XVZ8_UNCSA|nr:MAG: hypothetical protein COT42_08485 [Candidatus Saganbacteria bacterium CG08_land_8_20_14_0_20_45_16]